MLFSRLSPRMRVSLLMLFMTLVLFFTYLISGHYKKSTSEDEIKSEENQAAERQVQGKIKQKFTINYDELEDEKTQKLISERKERYGISESMDIIISSDEKLRIGDKTLDMREFEEKEALKSSTIRSYSLDESEDKLLSRDYGLHMVKEGDNIWKIHFRILKDALRSRGLELPDKADTPDDKGYSSGVGKVLKFSEQMVSIYNLEEEKFSEDINILKPFEKVLIYKMGELEELLDSLNQENIQKIRFDGKRIWISFD